MCSQWVSMHQYLELGMDELDENLKNLIQLHQYVEDNISDEHLKEAVKEFKQAFTDAGYVQAKNVHFHRYAKEQPIVMTGQEWYARFMAEKDKPEYAPMYRDEPLELIAKRAAGIIQ